MYNHGVCNPASTILKKRASQTTKETTARTEPLFRFFEWWTTLAGFAARGNCAQAWEVENWFWAFNSRFVKEGEY